MDGRSWLFGTSLVALLLAVGPTQARAQGAGYPELTRAEELRLAISAGPLAVSQRADVYIMGRAGFEKAIEGDNGWACIVIRSASDRSQLAPHCLNPAAVASVLPAFLLEGKLQARGLDGQATRAEMLRQFASGELPMPSGPAYAYMLSKGQRIGPNGGNFKPHFMLYVPYATNESIRGDPRRMQFPFVGPYENHPLSTVVIIMDEFVDPAAVVLPSR